MALKEAYNKDRSLLSKVLYGDPIAIGYIKVSLYYELKGCWRLRLEILTNEQFHLFMSTNRQASSNGTTRSSSVTGAQEPARSRFGEFGLFADLSDTEMAPILGKKKATGPTKPHATITRSAEMETNLNSETNY